ncbi:Pick C1-like protein 1 [Seminavis robusta]|uniref:Pick C1-like protein 1 n=1 Tax=Seminavis robusta TaxID=568900 RepID=A0A9N8HLA1_9STRA|nr:Pick C1-like protein 1 [Seminavis robusta]|eukprot:Sro1013_g231340.1 Pick C1-like protein 1 (939) ;mRNA; r:22426-25416
MSTTDKSRDSYLTSSESYGQSPSRKQTQWEKLTEEYIKQPILSFVIAIALVSARNPKTTVALTIFVSITVLIAGIFTNFKLVADGPELWAPSGTRTWEHWDWLNNEAGFPETAGGYVNFLIHSHGNNVLTVEGAGCLFAVVDTLRSVDGYADACYEAWGESECPMISPSALFDNNRTDFLRVATSDEMVQKAMSQMFFSSGEPILRERIFGYPEPPLPKDLGQNGTVSNEILMTSAASYLGMIPLYEGDKYLFEYNAVRALYALQDKWDQKGLDCKLEATSLRSVEDENMRGVEKDTPTMAAAFVIMAGLCAVYLGKYSDLVQSRALLGVGAIVTVVLSLMTSYGFMFIIGVPFTSIAQAFFYVMLGIGLDDTFIITGALDNKKKIEERIQCCMEEVGVSIVVSTLTTVVAFLLGCVASTPFIRWFCMYAAPTVAIDFVYQISFFVALVALDDQRVQDNRYDCLVCIHSKKVPTEEEEDDDDDAASRSCASKIMAVYCDILLIPQVKALVLAVFALMLGLGIYGATQQEQKLDFRDMMPSDSYVRTYYSTLHEYASEYSYGVLFLHAQVYFRDVDVSSPEIQRQMIDYIDDLVDMPYMSKGPDYFWLKHFLLFKELALKETDVIEAMPFNDQLDLFLKTSPFDLLYKDDIVRSEDGTVTASRCRVILDHTSNYDIDTQIDTYQLQQQVALSQPVNQVKDEWAFFLFTPYFFGWELHLVMMEELLTSLVLGLISVMIISALFIPHPFGPLIMPTIVGAVYVELMAFLRLAGLYLNIVSAIGLLMSIGLVVDYNMHVALTYYDTKNAKSRDERVRKVLTTMGASIFIAGLTTMASALPLGLSNSLSFQTFFYNFLGISMLGVAHGLILLPVVLSLCGPMDNLPSKNEGSKPSSSTMTQEESGREETDHTAEDSTKEAAFSEPTFSNFLLADDEISDEISV